MQVNMQTNFDWKSLEDRRKRNKVTSELNLLQAFQNLRNNSKLFDVSLHGTSQSVLPSNPLRAHKVILAAYSPVFRDMLCRQVTQSDPFIYLKGVNYNLIKSLLDFMYDGEVNILQSELASFMEVAEDLKIIGLQMRNEENRDASSNPNACPLGIKRDARVEIKTPSTLNINTKITPSMPDLSALEDTHVGGTGIRLVWNGENWEMSDQVMLKASGSSDQNFLMLNQFESFGNIHGQSLENGKTNSVMEDDVYIPKCDLENQERMESHAEETTYQIYDSISTVENLLQNGNITSSDKCSVEEHQDIKPVIPSGEMEARTDKENSVEFNTTGDTTNTKADLEIANNETVEDNPADISISATDTPENEPQSNCPAKTKFELLQCFDSKTALEQHLKTFDFSKYKVLERKKTKNGEYTVYGCIYGKRKGYKRCPSKIKIAIRLVNNSILFYRSENDHHIHEQLEGAANLSNRYDWKFNIKAKEMVLEGIQQKLTPSQILASMQNNGLNPLPNIKQLNNQVMLMRRASTSKINDYVYLSHGMSENRLKIS